jgi:AcrR family transcriptional regulator
MTEGVLTRPRDRIVGAARDLFHKQGYRGVGVDAIAEAAGTNKMTLYRHFDSKDDLIVECLRTAIAEGRAYCAEIEKRHPDDRNAQLGEWIKVAAEFIDSDCRGCDLSNAAVELADDGHPAHRVIEDFKQEHRNWLAAICADAGIARSELLADVLTTLLEGARIARQSARRERPPVDFALMAIAIVQSFKEAGLSSSRASMARAGKASLMTKQHRVAAKTAGISKSSFSSGR